MCCHTDVCCTLMEQHTCKQFLLTIKTCKHLELLHSYTIQCQTSEVDKTKNEQHAYMAKCILFTHSSISVFTAVVYLWFNCIDISVPEINCIHTYFLNNNNI